MQLKHKYFPSQRPGCCLAAPRWFHLGGGVADAPPEWEMGTWLKRHRNAAGGGKGGNLFMALALDG